MRPLLSLLSLAATCICGPRVAYAQTEIVREIKLNKAASGQIVPVSVRIHHSNTNKLGYDFKSGKKWQRGIQKFAGDFSALLVDINFDGFADLWVTGCPDGQCRVRQSDVWLFQPATRRYIYDRKLSALENLAIDPEAKLLESGISNCGCAAACFFFDIYTWRKGNLLKIARREQNCFPEDIIYREFELANGELRLRQEVKGGPNLQEATRRLKGKLQPLDWAKLSVNR